MLTTAIPDNALSL